MCRVGTPATGIRFEIILIDGVQFGVVRADSDDKVLVGRTAEVDVVQIVCRQGNAAVRVDRTDVQRHTVRQSVDRNVGNPLRGADVAVKHQTGITVRQIPQQFGVDNVGGQLWSHIQVGHVKDGQVL